MRIIRVSLEGRVKDAEVFEKIEDKPVVLGVGGLLPELEKTVAELRPGEEKTVELSPEQAYGQRKPDFVKIIPASTFKKSDARPVPGSVIFLEEGLAGRVQSTGGGRVRVDFNHPLAGKTLVFNVKALKEIESAEEKIRALFEVLFTKAKPADLKISLKNGEAEVVLPADCLKHEDFQARKIRFAQLAKEAGVQKISITEEY